MALCFFAFRAVFSGVSSSFVYIYIYKHHADLEDTPLTIPSKTSFFEFCTLFSLVRMYVCTYLKQLSFPVPLSLSIVIHHIHSSGIGFFRRLWKSVISQCCERDGCPGRWCWRSDTFSFFFLGRDILRSWLIGWRGLFCDVDRWLG